ncbi:MAG: protein phosphatase 2C domain-containing protein, partial [Candidatus Obscuribacterales bacterium]|nr:protein phosphatase 2C domain-containing protein [Candidatus Obscuribacterales bacterium]
MGNSLNDCIERWHVLSASEVGTSHKNSATPCQDYSLFRVLAMEEEEVLLICCSDGAGSAAYAEEASKLACERMLESMFIDISRVQDISLIEKQTVLF